MRYGTLSPLLTPHLPTKPPRFARAAVAGYGATGDVGNLPTSYSSSPTPKMSLDAFHASIRDARASGLTGGLVVPVARRLSADLLTPVSAFLTLRASRETGYGFLLESVEGGEKLARYSFLGVDPYRIVRADASGAVTVAERHGGGWDEEQSPRGFFATMERLMGAYDEIRVPGLPRLTGGAVGYLGYDGVRWVEHLPDVPPDTLGLPDAVWAFYDTVVAFDHVRRQVVLMHSVFLEHGATESEEHAAYLAAETALDSLEATLAAQQFGAPAPIELLASEMTSNVTPEAFAEAVEVARRYIYEGDIFQVVLSQRFGLPFEGDRFNLYRALRQVNPSPYLFFLDFEPANTDSDDDDTSDAGSFALVGSSPEVLCRVEDGRAEVLPIAGTRWRGATEAEDVALEAELLADPKERAEHLMLVDLGRNDLGRVCEYQSVQVDRYATVERYSHVMHIVSHVSGTVREGVSAMDVLAATFPAGTLSGAPKVRAMEIIDELEPTKRGVYGGAVGYVDFGGALDTCIAIRTMVVQSTPGADGLGGTAYVQAGGGIVADSDPMREYDESVNKARALREAMLVAGEGLL